MRRALFVLLGASACAGRATAPMRSAPAPALEFGAPEIVATASSQYSEVRLAMSPDGETMLWGSSDRPGGPGSYDIWISRRAGGVWSAPEPVPFDTDAKEFDPAFTADGRYVYFFSNRPGGLGGDDIYRVAVTADGFGEVEHLDAAVNSPGDEWAPFVHRNGTLLFSSNGRGGRGRQDLFVAVPRGTGFDRAEPVPGAVNTAADEFDATFLDETDLVFSRSTDVKRDPVLLVHARYSPSGYDAGTTLPATINVATGYTFGPSIDWLDPEILYFTGIRPEANRGKNDLYRVRFRQPPTADRVERVH
jgi:TolB protein